MIYILRTGGYHMKLLIVRHGDPDYTTDSLTPKGWKEVDYLSEKTCKTGCEGLFMSLLSEEPKTLHP